MLPIGCNTLYPHGLLGEEKTFDRGAICLALDRIAALGYEAIEFSHVAQLGPEDTGPIREHAASLGLRASFLAKTVPGEEGSGGHIHLSCWRGDRNAFARSSV